MSCSLHGYTTLSRVTRRVRPFGFRGKLIAAAALSALVPVGALALLLLTHRGHAASPGELMAVAAFGALVGAAGAGWLVAQLARPVLLTASALRSYLETFARPDLPTDRTFDEVGTLMADTQHAIERLDDIVVHVATYDRLTGLPNRALFRDQVRQAVAQSRRDGMPPLSMSVNLSARQFEHQDLVGLVREALDETGIDSSQLELEVTESLLMEDAKRTVQVLQALRDEGVTVSLDDFGTGYSSLGYLKHFPIDCIKLDKSFVRDAVTDAQSGAITSAVIALGHSLGLAVVAEGVETVEQLEYLADRACDVVQGFLFGRPMEASRVPEVVGERGAVVG